ncbi:hypothetical protein [Afifella marina]|uniref:Uncharacterized protein n=1 Tax=Afifella marina DSM 2698 TaxID=1120955 RepID=A0A1G5MF69_AFIMA|nr:hypothetical protein [Afifella marina]MBK1625221.1 hypothetical protein [Afifella marina DSM 2698]MBK1628938.1 hypothetical protein [Afifella marina]MBK5918317.1 hypothetical protein [Afifella marina]RAI22836.1 hypothetical protein CH311_04065 [Afifella marina DSM 2698]SCZ23786.1 hypothetical protein SAMN03080610_00603 [Afifella marina DSM 2698]
MAPKPHFRDLKELRPGEDGLWEIVLRLDRHGPFSVSDITGQTRLSVGAVSRYVARLYRGGYLAAAGERTHPRPWLSPAKLYRLVRRPTLPPRLNLDGSVRQEPDIETFWRTMKMLTVFTVNDLTSTFECPRTKEQAARLYVRRLVLAGVLVIVEASRVKGPGRGRAPAKLRLIRNLGARAPRVLSTPEGLVVFDSNAGEIVATIDGRGGDR